MSLQIPFTAVCWADKRRKVLPGSMYEVLAWIQVGTNYEILRTYVGRTLISAHLRQDKDISAAAHGSPIVRLGCVL